jgi:cytochrome P450
MTDQASSSRKRTRLEALGEVVRFIKDPLGTFTYLQQRWGDVVTLPLPGPPTVQFTHPDHVAALLRLPMKDQTTRSMEDIMGNGLLTATGPGWRRNRRMISPAFSQKAVAPFFETMCRLTGEWLAGVRQEQHEVDMTEEMLGLTLDVILKTVFGGAVKIDRAQVARAMEEYFYQFFLDNASWRRLVPRSIVTPGRRRRIRAMRELEQMVYRSIDQRRAAPAGDDLLHFMLQAKDESDGPLDDRTLRDEVLTLVLAGHETTAEMLTYAMWLLAQHPEAQAELRQEIAEVVGPDRPTRETLARCKLLDGVLDETLRLYPPAYVVAREAHEDMVLGGHSIRRGSQVLAPAWVVHRDERWWKQPEQFRPQRWLNGELDTQPQGAYFPFGGGPRLCIGKHLAKVEGSVVLLSLVQRFEFLPAPNYRLELMQSVTLRPRTGIRLVLRPAPIVKIGGRKTGALQLDAAG